MRKLLAWLLWLWLSAVIVGAFLYAPLAKGFIGQSSRILFFHVPMAWVSFVAFIAAGVWSLLFLWRRDPRHDRAAAVAVELGLLFGVLATVTGALWARVMWGAYWNWDPRQTSILVALLFYAAYLALRAAIEDGEIRARLAGAYAVLGLVVAPFLYFVMPRMAEFTLHPEPVVNAAGKVDMDGKMVLVLMASLAGFTALFYWMHNLCCRIQDLADRTTHSRGYTAP
jgi:heme exporter protein C